MSMNELFWVMVAVVLSVAWLISFKKPHPNPRKSPSDDASRPSTRQMGDSSDFGQNPSSRLFQNSKGAENLEFSPVRDLSLLANADPNPVAQAVTLMKYGRVEQAIEVLQLAFKSQPHSFDVGLKLAEVLLSTNDIKGFEIVEAQFVQLTNKEGPFWEALKIIKADYMGGEDHSATSVYKDFSSTEISNLGRPLTGFPQSRLSPASRM